MLILNARKFLLLEHRNVAIELISKSTEESRAGFIPKQKALNPYCI